MVLVLIPGLHLEKDASIGLHPEKRIISVQDPSQGPGGKCHVTGFYLWSVWEEDADLHSEIQICFSKVIKFIPYIKVTINSGIQH